MLITEPITLLTDYAIALEALCFSLLLARRLHQQITVWLWTGAFACVALAAFLGGTCHGFVQALDEATLALLWQLMLYGLSGAGSMMLLATIRSVLPYRWQWWNVLLVSCKFFVYWGWMMTYPSTELAFAYGVVDYLSAMLLVLILEMKALLRGSDKALWVGGGVLVSGVAIAFQASGLTLASFFNHNDLYHVTQMLALYSFYRGATLAKDR